MADSNYDVSSGKRYLATELARMFEVSDALVSRRLHACPHELRGKRKLYSVADAAPRILQVDDSERLDANQEIAKLNKHRAEAQAMKNAVANRELVPVALIVAAAAASAARMAAALDAVPAEIARANTALTHTDIARVKRALAKARNAAADIKIDWSALDA